MEALKFAVVVGVLSLACTDETKDKKQAPPSPTDKPVSTSHPPAPPPGQSEETLRELVHAPGGADPAQMTRLLLADGAARKWAPFSLALSCNQANSDKISAHLVTAVAAWMSESSPPPPDQLRTAAWAIGSCASSSAENILRGWLTPDPSSKKTGLAEAGVFGLGALADRSGTLSEQTQTALLDTASREGRAELLQPLGRIGRLSDAVGAHILEVTGTLLTKKESAGIRHAIFALGSAGPSAAAPLSQVLLSDHYAPQERAAAAQALSRLGGAGQDALDQTLRDILSRGLPTAFDRELWVPLRAIMEGLEQATTSKKELTKLSSLVLPEGTERPKVAQRRRLIWLRCEAARLLAEGRHESPFLLTCDPEKGRNFQLTQLRVLGEKELRGSRAKLHATYLKSEDPVVAQAALRLLANHPEVEDTAQILETALKSEHPGTQATAAQVIAAYPSRAEQPNSAEGPSDKIVSTLKALLTEDKSKPLAAETRASAIKAAGALRVLSLKPEIEILCDGPAEAMWEPAESALALLGTQEINCPRKPTKTPQNHKEFSGKATLVIDSDVGELLLHLDGRDAPVSAAHFLEKVDSGFYNGLQIHGGRAGFAVQFGDRDGDGYQDGASIPLPHEVSPRPFSALTFGMSAFSPGSHDTQIFVILSDAPQLHGSRVHLGRAEGPWHLLVVGDVLHSVKRRP